MQCRTVNHRWSKSEKYLDLALVLPLVSNMMLANYLMSLEELIKNLGAWGIKHTLFESEMSLKSTVY